MKGSALPGAPVSIGRQVATHCPYCASQCAMPLRGTPGFPTNQGGLCQKGWTAAELLDHPDRLTTPLPRHGKEGRLRPASWEEALAVVVARIEEIRARYGPDAVAVFGGGGLTNEKAYRRGHCQLVVHSRPVEGCAV